ncbi:ATP-binding protein [Paracraurococcus ruber]|uniref:Orc1-like AAA ATPase domain-containing protein n=2 Tax=Paracraurococcus ruber TaxID=77675 RepID=A0ABS1CWK0_9PROT|nr:ATP-binding protein [Paracraurococcus ruber]MBK1658099.1 hypothetical protein [Paracraurococcus ruber]
MLGFLRKRPQRSLPAQAPARKPAPEPRVALRPVGEVFTPSRPQRGGEAFVGREPERERIRQALEEDHVHVVIYADRGHGKTSLANCVAAELRARGAMVARYACEAESEFDEIMRGLMRDLPSSFLAVPTMATEDRPGCEAALPAGEVLPAAVASVPRWLVAGHLILIVDEFDRVRDEATRTRFADVIKRISDKGAPLSFVIVGVSASLEALLGRHPSIRRSIAGVKLPLMTVPEMEAIIELGERDAGVIFLPEARRGVTLLAGGVPYLVHLFALRAVQSARARGVRVISLRDLREAAIRIVRDSEPDTVARCEDLVQQFGVDAVAEFLSRFAQPAGSGGDQAGMTGAEVLDAAAHDLDSVLWDRLVEVGALLRTDKGGTALSDSGIGFYLLLHALSLGEDATEDERPEARLVAGNSGQEDWLAER